MLWGAGVILQADSDPGRDGVGPLWSSPLWKCPAGVYVCVGKRGEGLLGVILYCASLCPIELCGDLAGLALPSGESEGRGSEGS